MSKIGFVIVLLLLLSLTGSSQPPTSGRDPRWQTRGSSVSASIPGSCTANRDVWICTNCAAGAAIYYCIGGTYQAQGGGGTAVNVNGASVSNPNFNATTPAAEAGYANVKFQVSGSSVSGEILPALEGAGYCPGGGIYPSCTASTTAATVDPANGFNQAILLTAANTCVMTITQPASGTARLRIKIKQAATPTGVVTWPVCVLGTSGSCWPAGLPPVITTTASAVDIISCFLDGTNAFCTSSPDFR